MSDDERRRRLALAFDLLLAVGDWTVWRTIVDQGITTPDLIKMQIIARQEELQRQGESVDGEIAHARRRLAEVDQERAFYQRAAAKGKITEAEFDGRMDETEEAVKYWQGEIKRLMELRDDAAKVQAGLDYVTGLLGALQERLPTIDQTPDELRAMPKEQREAILRERQEIIRALVKEVRIWHTGQVKIIGVLDGTEGGRFDLTASPTCRCWNGWATRWRSTPIPNCGGWPNSAPGR